jgi:hypothetical protein
MREESEEQKQERLKILMKTGEIIKSGHAGILSNGNIVDMREYPNAIKIPPNNPFLKIHPLEAIQKGKEASELDYKEDFSHENGNYFNECTKCKKEFLGHKRRVVCRKCLNSKD